MKFIILAALFGATLAIPTPHAAPGSNAHPSKWDSFDRPTRKEIKISEIRVKKHGWPLRFITSVDIRLDWAGTQTTCTAYRLPGDGLDHCDDEQFEFHLENKLRDQGPSLLVRKKTDGSQSQITADLPPHKDDWDSDEGSKMCEHHIGRGTVRIPQHNRVLFSTPPLRKLTELSRSASSMRTSLKMYLSRAPVRVTDAGAEEN